MLCAFLLASSTQGASLSEAALRAALDTGDQTVLGKAPKMLAMASRRGGPKSLQVSVFPAPPGWGKSGEQWAIFHTFQDIQQDRDYVARLGPDGLGEEVPEQDTSGQAIRHQKVAAKLWPADGRVEGRTETAMTGAAQKAVLFRLNSPYQIKRAMVNGAAWPVVAANPKAGQVLRVGGLIIPWTIQTIRTLTLEYEGIIRTPGHDKVSPEACYLTAWWMPSLGRLPFTTELTVEGPAGWRLVGEGIPIATTAKAPAGRQVAAFRCDMPISYPKIIAGPYKLMAELKDGSKTYRSWQLEPTDEERAERDVRLIQRGMRFFESKLTPFPFPGYDVYDADTYYGIESYSHTLLNRRVTSRFVTHELGHTWFGGVCNCPYVEDTWNEGVTQYVDSVVLDENRDRTLETGLRSLGINVPLSQMDVAYAHQGQSYYRGAYVTGMLRRELGDDAFWAGLRGLLTSRKGMASRWADLRKPFEDASGKDLRWFWAQWIDGSVFPTLNLDSIRKSSSGWTANISQSGALAPFRIRAEVVLRAGSQSHRQMVELTRTSQSFTITPGFEPTEAELVVFPYTLCRVRTAKVTASAGL